MDELYRTLGKAKSAELNRKSYTFNDHQRYIFASYFAPIGGAVREGLARDFIREFLPPGFGLKSGLVFDAEKRAVSPQCDAIIYKGAPLLEFTDVIVAEKKQVKAIFEIKAFIDQGTIFGRKIKGTKDRNPKSGLVSAFKRRKDFLPAEAKYILFAFGLSSSSNDNEVVERLNKICGCKENHGSYAIILRWEPRKQQKPNTYNFDNSISRLIEWLRNLS